MAERATGMAFAIAMLLAVPAAAQTFSGTARTIDGDTIIVHDVHVRIFGIDAPELHQDCQRADGQPWPCGVIAKALMHQLAEGRWADCLRKDTDRYGRTVAVCWIANTDIGRAMVDAGMARAFIRYSAEYVPEEQRAKAAGRGIWQGPHEPAWDWRREHKGSGR